MDYGTQIKLQQNRNANVNENLRRKTQNPVTKTQAKYKPNEDRLK